MNFALILTEPQLEVLWSIIDSAVAVGIWGNQERSPADAIHYALLRDKVQAIEIKRQAHHREKQALAERARASHV